MNFKTFLYRFQFYGLGVLLGIIAVIIFFGDRDFSCAYFPNQRVIKKIIDQKPALPSEICGQDTVQFFTQLYKHGQVNFSESNIRDTEQKQYLIHLQSGDTLNMDLSFVFQNDTVVLLERLDCN